MNKIVEQLSPHIKVIIGLGNPGPQFKFTRHNIGFQVVDALVEKYDGAWQKKDKMLCASISINDQQVLVVKPQTFMNSSGEVIPGLLKKGIKSETILVVHDELEKPFGSLMLKQSGSHKGHNGLRSLIVTATADFWRLRFGIGRPERKEDVPHYVLENFKEPAESINLLIQKSISLIEATFS
ncbi:aminoacyl-tRNA hydrolase [bacterium]|nr:aminoacyl-tRNA hydrolase [bacterium]